MRIAPPTVFAIVTLMFLASCSHAASSAGAGTGAASAPILAGAAAPVPSALPDGVTQEMVSQGKALFNAGSCQKCHGLDGTGTVRAPNLTDKEWIHITRAYPAIVDLVKTGFTKSEQRDSRYPFTMNPRGGTNMSDAEIRAVAAYVWSISAP